MKKTQGIGVRDVFPRTALEASRTATEVGFYLKRSKAVSRFRVVNERNTPKLMVMKEGERYAEVEKNVFEDAVGVLRREET